MPLTRLVVRGVLGSITILLLLLLSSMPTARAAATVYVSVSGGSDSYSCNSTDLPCATLQGALKVLGSSPGTVVIAAGVYTGANNTGLTLATANVTLVGVGDVRFDGNGTLAGWTLSGVGVQVVNLAFSRFYSTGTARDCLHLRILWLIL